jgi:hypothetical protein
VADDDDIEGGLSPNACLGSRRNGEGDGDLDCADAGLSSAVGDKKGFTEIGSSCISSRSSVAVSLFNSSWLAATLEVVESVDGR